jgi:serine/threonine-protein kinase RsbW
MLTSGMETRMETGPVTVTFPAVPEYLRLARIATADAASRAGLDYEEIDDVRIAVSELCSLVSVDAGATITLTFEVSNGVVEVDGESRTGSAPIRPSELSVAIVTAVTDEHRMATHDGVTSFRVVKRARSPRP